MIEKVLKTAKGTIHYWTEAGETGGYTLVFLPGLTADQRLFESQVRYFKGKYDLLVWDAPGHAASRPFTMDFTLEDKARWLGEILDAEGITEPVLIGQSMGGYVGQAFLQLYPGRSRGFIAIDSTPLGREYSTSAELWLLKRTEWIYRSYPWRMLVNAGARGVAETEAGRRSMREMMEVYSGHKREYARLTAHGYRMLAEAIEARKDYRIDCPALLICGKQDRAGSTRRYNRAWHARTGIPIEWIDGAGHNSNTDKPEEINALIERFLDGLKGQRKDRY